MKHSSLFAHAAASIIVTAILLCTYASVQQTYRSSANDPQIQIVRDISSALSKKRSIKELLPVDTIDLEQSIAVFAELFDKSGKPVQSTGLLNGELPQPPQGVIDYTNTNNEDMITWQPQSNVRMAMIFEKLNTAGIGYVAVGRSLKETEIRESNLLKMVAIVWVACMGVLLTHLLIQIYLHKKIFNKQIV